MRPTLFHSSVCMRHLICKQLQDQHYQTIEMQTICGLSGLNMSILRYVRHRRYRTDRQHNKIKEYLDLCLQDCDRTSTRLVIRLLVDIITSPDRPDLRVALPVIVSLARRLHNTQTDQRMLTAFYILGQCLSPRSF